MNTQTLFSYYSSHLHLIAEWCLSSMNTIQRTYKVKKSTNRLVNEQSFFLRWFLHWYKNNNNRKFQMKFNRCRLNEIYKLKQIFITHKLQGNRFQTIFVPMDFKYTEAVWNNLPYDRRQFSITLLAELSELAEWRSGSVSALPCERPGFGPRTRLREIIPVNNCTMQGQNNWGNWGSPGVMKLWVAWEVLRWLMKFRGVM